MNSQGDRTVIDAHTITSVAVCTVSQKSENGKYFIKKLHYILVYMNTIYKLKFL